MDWRMARPPEKVPWAGTCVRPAYLREEDSVTAAVIASGALARICDRSCWSRRLRKLAPGVAGATGMSRRARACDARSDTHPGRRWSWGSGRGSATSSTRRHGGGSACGRTTSARARSLAEWYPHLLGLTCSARFTCDTPRDTDAPAFGAALKAAGA